MRTFRRTSTRPISLALSLLAAATLTSACGDSPNAPSTVATAPPGAPPSAVPGAPDPQPSTGPTVVALATYDGSGEAVHPDGVTTPPGWSAVTAHIVATPYPGGAVRFENPSYYDVLSSFLWVPPQDAVNPVAVTSGSSHLSDPDMVYDPDTRTMWMYYREATMDTNRIYVVRSKDGSHWDTPVSVLAVPNHLAISPAVVRRRTGDWLMWTVNGGAEGCGASSTTIELRRSADGLTWSAPDPVQIQSDGEYPWHVEVEWVPSRREYWAVYNTKAPGSCMTKVLRFATSPDGVTWNVFPSPLLRAGAIPAFADVVYRSSISYDAASDLVTILYSGARAVGKTYAWQLATEQLDLRALIARVTAPRQSMATRAMLPETRTAPDLTNETAP